MLVIAHRGAVEHGPENTLTAFYQAWQKGAQGIELDVQLSADGEVVVFHDELLARLTIEEGYLKDKAWPELNALKIGEKERIPLLAEVLELMAGNNLLINIELKNSYFPYRGLAAKVRALVRQAKIEDRVIISSFNRGSILESRREEPSFKYALLWEEEKAWLAKTQALGFNLAHPEYNLLTPEMLQAAAQEGIGVNVWFQRNTDDEEFWRKPLPVGGVITNYLSLAKRPK